MTYTAATPYRLIGDTTLAAYEAEFRRVGSPMLQDVAAIYAAALPHSALFLAMAWHEQRYATTSKSIRPDQHNPVGLRPWDGDPAGMPPGATGRITVSNGGQYLVFDSFANCIREWKRRLFDDPAYKGGVYARTTTLQQMIDTYAPPGDVHEVTGIDNADSGYGADVLALLNRLEAAGLLPANVEASPMAKTFVKHTWPGLKNPVYLPDWIPVEIKLIPSSVPGWTSGQKIPAANFTSTTFHDTGNLLSSANSEYTWARDGGRAEINSPGSYNGIYDQSRVIISQRFDELVGHAANHTGNITSYAFEQAGIGPKFDFDKSLDVGLWVHAGVLHAMGRLADTSMYQHNYWSGKNCPGQVRRKGLWSYCEKTVDQHIAEIAASLVGDVTEPTPIYATVSPIPVLDAVSGKDVVAPSYVVIPNENVTAFFVGDRYEAIRDTPRSQFAYKGSPALNAPIKKGESFNVDFVFENAEGRWAYTPFGTRVWLDDLIRVSDQKEEAA